MVIIFKNRISKTTIIIRNHSRTSASRWSRRGSYRIRTRTPIDEPMTDDSSPEDILGGTAFDLED